MTLRRTPLRNVVLATDFSPGATAALRRAEWLPFAPGSTLTLLHAIPESIPADLRDDVADRAVATLRGLAADAARALEARGAEVAVQVEVVDGTPYIEIVRQARSRRADLIVLGRHGAKPVSDEFVGSTAERVVRKGESPVLLVHQDASGPYRRPLVAIDLSDVSAVVADLALTLLPEDVRTLRFVHAVHLGVEGWLGAGAVEDYKREALRAAERRTRAITEGCTAQGIHCDVAVLQGDPRIAVCCEALRDGSDLVIIGTHARSGLAHVLLGSVAEWLIRAAPCDIAVTRPERFTFELP